MSTITLSTAHPLVERFARAFDLLEACRTAKLPDDRRKHMMLAKVMRATAAELREIKETQNVAPTTEFVFMAYQQWELIKQQRAALHKYLKEKRERMEAEREALLASFAAEDAAAAA
jgi:protein-disulfide isomerase-like protein with CxxC motif